MSLPEIPLREGTLVVADLHLDPLEVDGAARFVAWLERQRGAPGLVVLGDLFEFWFGPAQLEEAAVVTGALRAAADAGTRVDLVPGNRDFLLGRGFERASGVRLRPHGALGTTPGGERVLLVHGDELCTLDRPYQRLRAVLRSAPVRGIAPLLPRAVGRLAARRLRRASRSAVAAKPGPLVEQQPDACRELARRHGATTVACGHAHRFRDERLAGGPRWLVVDAFGGPRDTLVVRGGALVARGAP